MTTYLERIRLFFLLIVFISPISFASSSDAKLKTDQSFSALTFPNNLRFFATINLGPAWTNSNRSQIINLEPDVVKRYAKSNSNHTLVNGELFLGVLHPWNNCLRSQCGLALAASSHARMQGDIWEDADPAFNNFNYNYKVDHYYIGIKSKLIMHNCYVEPYVSASLGVGFNRSYDFSIKPKIFEEIPAPPFHANSTTAFSYTVGAGIQKTVDRNWEVGIGYEFADWGKSNLNRASGQTVGSGLSLNHIYAHELLFSVTYLT